MALFKKAKKSRSEARAESIREERKYLIWRNSDFFLREAYKTTRTNVMFSIAGKEGCAVIAVTSALQSEGKSITAANLGLSFAAADKRVLLIDCDMRKPKAGRLLHPEQKTCVDAPGNGKNGVSFPDFRRKG